MRARLLLILAMFLGIALAPVQPVLASCAPAAPIACESCCEDSAHSCCAASTAPAPRVPLAPVTSTDDGKVLAPALVFLGLSPTPVAERPAVHRTQAARLPALPLLSRTCILLI